MGCRGKNCPNLRKLFSFRTLTTVNIMILEYSHNLLINQHINIFLWTVNNFLLYVQLIFRYKVARGWITINGVHNIHSNLAK